MPSAPMQTSPVSGATADSGHRLRHGAVARHDLKTFFLCVCVFASAQGIKLRHQGLYSNFTCVPYKNMPLSQSAIAERDIFGRNTSWGTGPGLKMKEQAFCQAEDASKMCKVKKKVQNFLPFLDKLPYLGWQNDFFWYLPVDLSGEALGQYRKWVAPADSFISRKLNFSSFFSSVQFITLKGPCKVVQKVAIKCIHYVE